MLIADDHSNVDHSILVILWMNATTKNLVVFNH